MNIKGFVLLDFGSKTIFRKGKNITVAATYSNVICVCIFRIREHKQVVVKFVCLRHTLLKRVKLYTNLIRPAA